MAPLHSLATLLLASTTALALSAHSPRDLESHPAFSVGWGKEVLNETVSTLLAEQLETPPHASPPKRHLLRSVSGQAFLCTVPSVTDASKKQAEVQADKNALVQAEERERGVQHGLALLEPMKTGCLYLKQGWFTYSFCYGNEIRQFHQIYVPGAVGPTEDPHTESYVLAVAPEPTPHEVLGSTSSDVVRQEALISSKLGGGDGVGWDESGKYLTQTWTGGTICDKTGLPRSVEVQFHCNTQTIDRIALIRETSICRYVLLIHTPRLCSEPLFLESQLKNVEPAATIECQPVVRKIPQQLPDATADAAAPEAEQAAARETTSASIIDDGAAPPSPQPAAPPSPDTASAPLPVSADAPPPLTPAQDADHHDHYDDNEDDLEMVTLVYDPETGHIESAVTDYGEDLFVDSELRRQLFGDGEHGGEGRQPENPDAAAVEVATMQSLEELTALMRETLAAALRGDGDPPPGADHAALPPGQAAAGHADRLQAIVDAIGGLAQPERERRKAEKESAEKEGKGRMRSDGSKVKVGLVKYLEGFEREKATVQVPREAVIGSEAHEKLKRGFERRYDQEEEAEEKPAHDEL